MYFLVGVVIILILIYIFDLLNDKYVKETLNFEKLVHVENKYKKTYPIGNDRFSIKHFPKYESFFDQFNNYKYMVLTNNTDNTFATCCIAKLSNIMYICDLKSFELGNAVTYKFGKYIFLNYIMTFQIKPNFFGIVMEPNNSVNHITTKYFFKKYGTLYLYQITYQTYLKHVDLINNIFPDHFFVSGYKKFVLESTGEFMKVCHIAQPIDSKYVKLQDKINIDLSTELMFCLPEMSKHCSNLEMVDIKPSSKMSIIGIGCGCVTDWSFIKTFMI